MNGVGWNNVRFDTQGQYWNEPHYYVYLMTPKYYTELDGKKYPFTGKLNKPRVIILTK